MMNCNDNKICLIGEKVKVENEKEIGTVTRIDFDSNMIYVLFKKMIEKPYPFPEALNKDIIKPILKLINDKL